MTKTKKTLGINWTRYHNLYGVTYKLHEGMQSLGWSVELIQKYIIDPADTISFTVIAIVSHALPGQTFIG